MGEFIRKFTKTVELKKDDLFREKLLDNIKTHDNDCVFPAIRKNYMSFYYKGGSLFEYRSNRKFTTNMKYSTDFKGVENIYKSQEELLNSGIEISFIDSYDKIKERCFGYSKEEAEGVSNLFKYNVTNDKTNIFLLDKEIALGTKENIVDLLFFNKTTKTLLFVEAKRYSNKEFCLLENGKNKVFNQINRYKNEIEKRKDEIIEQYSNYIKELNTLFDLNLPEPDNISLDVGLLIFDFNDEQKTKIPKSIIEKNDLGDVPLHTVNTMLNVDIEKLYNDLIKTNQ